MDSSKLKENFVDMCRIIQLTPSGFAFFFDEFENDESHSLLTDSEDYPVLKSKMINLIKLINSDHSFGEKDVENELWDLI